MFAIVDIGGKQYKVKPRDLVEVDRIEGQVGETVTFDRILLAVDEGKISVGKPYVKGFRAKAKIIEQGKGEKIEVRRFKAKVRYRRKRGFRPSITKLEILSVGRA